MKILAVNPEGDMTHLPLDAIVWRLGLLHLPSTPHRGSILGVGFRYCASGTVASAMVAGADLETRTDAGVGIATIGMPKGNLKDDVDRFRESLKILHNANDLKPQRVAQIIQDADALPEVYYQLRDALWSRKPLERAFHGWHYRLEA